MSYVLINGTRYYKNDRTGKVTMDTASAEEAERRAGGNAGGSSCSRTPDGSLPGYHPSAGGSSGTARTGSRHIFRKIFLVILALQLLPAAAQCGSSRLSSAQQTISGYMKAAAEIAQSSSSRTSAASAASAVQSTSAAQSSAAETDQQDRYLLPESDSRYLTEQEIAGCSREEIQLMINEIYARHGRAFQSQNNRDYFSSRDWYSPVSGKSDETIEQEFNEYEKVNVDFLSSHL